MTLEYEGTYTAIPGLLAGADLSGSQYLFVKYASTAGEVVALAATTDIVAGVLLNAPADGAAALVASQGTVPIIAGTSTITAGAALTPSAAGKAITGGATAYGRSEQAAGADDDVIQIQLGVN